MWVYCVVHRYDTMSLAHKTIRSKCSNLLVVSQLDGLHLLGPVLVVLEAVLDRQGLEELHGCLGSDLWNPVEEEDFFFGMASVV